MEKYGANGGYAHVKPSPCETKNGGRGCGFRLTCEKRRMACFQFWLYVVERKPVHDTDEFHSVSHIPSEKIYSLVFTDGIEISEKGPHGVALDHMEVYGA